MGGAPDRPEEGPAIVVAKPSQFFRYIFISWYSPLLRLGWKRPLQHDDLPLLPAHLTTADGLPKFEKHWQDLLKDARSSPEGMKKLERTEKGEYAMFLFRCIVALSGHLMLCSIGLQLTYAGFQFAGPVLLNRIVSFLQSQAVPGEGGGGEGRAYGYAVAMLIFPLLAGLAFAHASRFAIQVQVRVRAQLTAAVYRKALRLSPSARQRTEVGRVVNLMSNDVNTIMTFFYPFANQLFSAPLMLITALILLFFQISWATLIGLAILMLSTPASGSFVKRLTRLRRDMLKHTDQRIKLTNQLLVGIRVLKIYAWEAAQEAAVNDARVKELGRLGAAIPSRVGMQTLLFAAPVLAAVCSFAVYGAVQPANFTAARIFSAIALFGIMRIPLVLLPFALVEAGNAFVSMRRLSQFLVLEEREDNVGKLPEVGIEIKGASFYWPRLEKLVFAQAPPPNQGLLGWLFLLLKSLWNRNKSKEEVGGKAPAAAANNPKDIAGGSPIGVPMGTPSPAAHAKSKEDELTVSDSSSLGRSSPSIGTLKAGGESPPGGTVGPAGGMAADATWWLSDINLHVTQGELVCVVGRVGSGKSSLVDAILGEMSLESGSVAVGGRVAYVAQQAWIVNDTLKNNVLFGKPYESQRWHSTTEACSLVSDLAVLPGGDATEIGEKGINLSGGQKSRISLARAVYSDADLYILDDPLSAVDVHVGRHIFESCIQGLLSNKTRLLVTNQLQYLGAASRIVYLENGCIAAQGSLEEVSRNPGFAALLADFNAKAGALSEEESVNDGPEPETAAPASPLSPAASPRSPGGGPPGPRSARGNALLSLPTFVSALPRDENQRYSEDPAGPGSPEGTPGSPRVQKRLLRIPTADIEHGIEVEAANIAGAARGALGHTSPEAVEDAFREYAGAAAGPSPEEEQEAEREAAASPGSPRHRGRRDLGDELIDLVVGRPSVDTAGARPGSASLDTPSRPSTDRPTSHRRLSESKEGWAAPLTPRSEGPGSPVGDRAMVPQAGSPPVSAKSLQSVASPKAAPKNAGLVVGEDREVGSIGYGVYVAYARMYSLIFLQLLILLWASEQTTRVLTNWWLSKWTGAQASYDLSRQLGIPGGPEPKQKYLGGYLGFSLAFVALVAMRSTTNLTSALRASRKMHHSSLHSVVRAPVSFFDTTPIGRILNRFSKDMDDIDYLLPQSMNDFGNCIMQLLATLIFISVIQPWFLVGMVPLMVVYFCIQKFYRRSYVELQRTDAVTRSPLYAHFSETLSGVDSIRAFGVSQRFAERSDHQVDFNHRAYFALRTADQWLSLRLDVIGASLSFTTAILAVANRGRIPTSLAAVTLSEVLDVTGFLKFAVQMAAMFESRFNSVERLLTYQHLPQEAAPIVPDNRPPPDWPGKGELEFSDVWMRYRPDLDPVLKGVSFRVEAREKVGIVGRTGSGKSSLIVALFRMVEPFRGQIVLDGINLLTVGLQDVRGRIAAIPQDPVLFSGTVRSNLDPYDRHQDHELWEALSHVALKEVVGANPEGLQAGVAEGGDNWSMGQRQLLCVARALLRRPRVLVADEATASVDGETDALIQRTIRANFSESTVLTIAHRLNTILDSSKVLVMDAGVKKEFGTVEELMSIPDGTFRNMVEGAGLSSDASS